MAEALLARHLTKAGIAASVRSAGLLGEGAAPPPEVISAMAGYGINVGSHCSRLVTAAELHRADLVIAMARVQLRHAVVKAPGAWPRAFTLKELVRRGEEIGARAPREGLSQWLARAHGTRKRRELLGDSQADDVADPIGGPLHGYIDIAATLDGLLGRLVELCWGMRRV
jgi:protein-tyrosine-phosphatase